MKTKVKIEIKSIYGGVIFGYSKVDNTLKNTLIQAVQKGAYLRGAYLRDADLQGADLQGADLRDADLQDAYLQGADLQDADLQGADLQDAYLRGADLRGAGFTPWNKMIDTPIINTTRLPVEDVVAAILYELTFWGWSNKQVKSKTKEILGRCKESIENIESGKSKSYTPKEFKKLLKSFKKNKK